MTVPLAALIIVVMTGWVAVDAARRQRNWLAWAGLVAVTGIFGLIVWIIARRRSPVVVNHLGAWGVLKVLTPALPLFLLPILIALVTVTFLFQVARIEGHAMEPTIADDDRLIVNKLAYRLHKPQRRDIVMMYYPNNPDKTFVKRVVAEEGDEVRLIAGHVYLNGVRLDESFVAREFLGQSNWGPQVVPEGITSSWATIVTIARTAGTGDTCRRNTLLEKCGRAGGRSRDRAHSRARLSHLGTAPPLPERRH